MAIGGIGQAGKAVLHSFKENVLKPVFGRFLNRSAAKTKTNASVAQQQSPHSGKTPDTPLAKRTAVSQDPPASILKKGAATGDPKQVSFAAKLPPHEDRSGNKYDLRNHEQSYLREQFEDSRPGPVRRVIYKLKLNAPSHPKEKVAEFRSYLKESATNLQQLDDIQVFIKGEKLADCQVNRALREHRHTLLAARTAEVIVEVLLAGQSKSGDDLENRLVHLLDDPGRLANKLRSPSLYAELARDVGLSSRTPPKQVLSALGLRNTQDLHSAVFNQLEQYATQFEKDPEAAQDILDTLDPDGFQGTSLAANDWSKIKDA
ncbi:hypothetical protein [Spongorhabdus nitratireducens]